MDNAIKASTAAIEAKTKNKVKRSSKICSALKTRFLEILQDEGTTIKQVFNSLIQAAKHLGINYSTAKVIAKENKHVLREKTTSNSDCEE